MSDKESLVNWQWNLSLAGAFTDANWACVWIRERHVLQRAQGHSSCGTGMRHTECLACARLSRDA